LGFLDSAFLLEWQAWIESRQHRLFGFIVGILCRDDSGRTAKDAQIAIGGERRRPPVVRL